MTYAEFKSLVQAYLHQEGNPKIADQVDNFIALGEAPINRVARTQQMLGTVLVSELATGDPVTYPVPSDFLEVYGIWEDDDPVEYVQVDKLRKLGQETQTANCPPYYSVFGGYLIFTKAVTDSMTLTYYAKPTALASISGEINTSLFPKHMDLYLYSAMAEAAPLLRDEQRGAYWQTKRDTVFAEMKLEDWSSHLPKAQPLRIRYAS